MNLKSNETMGADFVRNLGQAVRRNPVSTALIGMGVLWLFSGGRTVDAAQRLARRSGLDKLPDVASDALSQGRSAVQSGVAAVSEQLSDVAGQASDLAQRIPEKGSDLFGAARNRLGDMLEEQPLLLGAVGLAIGAGIAASLPTTRIEAEVFGETSDEFKARAAAFVGEQTERVGDLASQAVDAVSQEAKRQGFAPEDLQAEAREIGDKVKRAAASAGSRIQSAE